MLMQITVWFAIYVGLLAMYQLFSYLEHRKHEEKRRRYQALPLRFKLACTLLALPLFTTSLFGFLENNNWLKFLWVVGLVITLIIETKVIDWYKNNGLF